MDGNQIHKILKNNPYTKHNFLGVFPADGLPKYIDRCPASLVVNTDKAGKSGKHWQAIYLPNKYSIEFFDSFGKPPAGPIRIWLDNFYTKKIFPYKNLQAKFETSCGPHVIFFLISRSMGKSFKEILKILKECDGLTSKPDFADSFVKLFTASINSLHLY
jgi:hypothetical protein